MTIKKLLSQLSAILIASSVALTTQAQSYHLPNLEDRWAVQPDGSIQWNVNGRLPHSDHIEMSGQKVSLWIQYGVDSAARPSITRTMIFPTFRLLPTRTIAHMMY